MWFDETDLFFFFSFSFFNVGERSSLPLSARAAPNEFVGYFPVRTFPRVSRVLLVGMRIRERVLSITGIIARAAVHNPGGEAVDTLNHASSLKRRFNVHIAIATTGSRARAAEWAVPFISAARLGQIVVDSAPAVARYRSRYTVRRGAAPPSPSASSSDGSHFDSATFL